MTADGITLATDTPQAHIADATFAGSDTLTDADTDLGATTQAELEGVLQNLGDTCNAILAALENAGILATS